MAFALASAQLCIGTLGQRPHHQQTVPLVQLGAQQVQPCLGSQPPVAGLHCRGEKRRHEYSWTAAGIYQDVYAHTDTMQLTCLESLPINPDLYLRKPVAGEAESKTHEQLPCAQCHEA